MNSDTIQEIRNLINTDNNISALNFNGQSVKVLVDRIESLEKENDILWRRHNDY